MTGRRVRLCAAASALLMGMLTGCSGSSTGAYGGPFDGKDWEPINSGNVCIPARPGGTVTFGGDPLDNYGDQKAVIDKVTLLSPHGVRVVGAFLIGKRKSYLGYSATFPPSAFFLRSVGMTAWKARRPAVGATLPPEGPKERAVSAYNLVTAIRVTGTTHVGMRAVIVDYHVGTEKYRWHNLISLTVETRRKQCF